MKGLKKVLLLTATAALSATAIGLAACNSALNGTYEGEYKYDNPWVEGAYYGVKVSVVVEEDIIQSVSIIESDYTQATSTWENVEYYKANEASLLAAYAGKSVDDILSMEVAVEDTGEPTVQSSESFSSYDSDLLLTNATQSSGRLLLAVQDALKNA